MKNLITGLLFTFAIVKIQAAVPNSDHLDFGTQITLAKNIKLPMSSRWQALVKAAEVATYLQIDEIKKIGRAHV